MIDVLPEQALHLPSYSRSVSLAPAADTIPINNMIKVQTMYN